MNRPVSPEEKSAKRLVELEREIARIKTWLPKPQDYELRELGDGATAYILSESAASQSMRERLCVQCMGNGARGVLGQNAKDENSLVCSECGGVVSLRPRVKAKPIAKAKWK